MRLDRGISHPETRGHLAEDEPVLVLSRRNLQGLLDKLDDPQSARTFVSQGWAVHAEDDEVHYSHPARHGAPPGTMLTNGKFQ